MNFLSLSQMHRSRGALYPLLALTGAAFMTGCGGGSGGPSGGSGGGGGGGNNNNGLSAESIVFVSNRDGNPEIYTGSNTTASGTQTRITANTANDTNPFLAPNRQFIAFVSTRTFTANGVNDTNGDGEIFRYNFSDQSFQALTTDATSVQDTNPVVSPNSNSIAWVSERGGSNNVWIMDSTGANQRPVSAVAGAGSTITLQGGTAPTFSPDSTQLAYVDNNNNIRIVNLNSNSGAAIGSTGTARVIATALTGSTRIPLLAWSPNGNSIAYLDPVTGGGTVRIVSATATSTSGAPTVAATPNPKTGFSWGPDSTRLVFVAPGTGGNQVFLAASPQTAAGTAVTSVGANSDVSWTN